MRMAAFARLGREVHPLAFRLPAPLSAATTVLATALSFSFLPRVPILGTSSVLIPGAGPYLSTTLGLTYSRHLALSAPGLSLPLVPAPGIPQSDAHKPLQAIHPTSRLRVPRPAIPLVTNNAEDSGGVDGSARDAPAGHEHAGPS
jgi:hypothetical protein